MTQSKADAYSTLAVFYDRLMSGYPYSCVIDRILETVQGKGIDLGTGSGKFAIALENNGHKVVGVDSSQEMLERAKINARKAGVKPIFVKEDITKLDIPRVDFVTAMCDVFNYLPQLSHLEKLLKRIYSALNAGGKLIFDISSEYKLANMAGEQYFEDCDEITYLWCNKRIKDKLIMDLTFFIPKGEDVYTRCDERHTMLVLNSEKLKDILKKCGFEVEIYGDNLKKCSKKDNRVFFFCKKNG